MKIQYTLLICTVWLALLFPSSLTSTLHAQPTDNPIATFYNGDEGYPAWTDNIKWDNVINMQTYSNGANDFEKFEHARDVLYAQGGGVLYYPAGIYDFSDIPQGPNGRGLLLKKGVVIRGDAPLTDAKAIPDGYVRYRTTAGRDSLTAQQRENHGLDSLKTIFRFPFRQVYDANGNLKDVPDMWNLVGIMPDSATTGQRLKDVDLVGIAWVKLEGGVIFMGPDFSDYNSGTPWSSIGSWLGSKSKNGTGTKNWGNENWAGRVANGTHYFDPFAGSASNGKLYIKGARGRFVFGCHLENATLNGSVIDFSGLSNQDFLDGGYRFGARITMHGSNVFVANNVISKPDKSFKFLQKTINRSGYLVAKNTVDTNTLLFNYAYSIGIDVNKQSCSQAINRNHLDSGAYYEDGIIIRDNWVYQFGNKAYESAGKFVTIQNNVTYRDYYVERTDPFGLDAEYPLYPGWRMAMNSWSEVKLADDMMTRGFDVGGQYFWIDNNWYDGCGSVSYYGAEQPNDGEGILVQRHGGVEAFSFAMTRNTQGPIGHQGGMNVYTTHAIGWFQAWNNVQKTSSNVYGVGVAGSNDYLADASVTGNLLWDKTTGVSTLLDDCAVQQLRCQTPGVNNIKDFMYLCPGSASKDPLEVSSHADPEKNCVVIAWKPDTTDHNEIGFRIERSINSGSWHTIAYRPRKEWLDSMTYTGADNSGVPAGFGAPVQQDFNRPRWNDYTAPAGTTVKYRVSSIDCNDNPLTFVETNPIVITEEKNNPIEKAPMLLVFPNPAVDYITVQSAEGVHSVALFSVDGKRQSYQVLNGETSATISLQHVPDGCCYIQITLKNGRVLTRKMIKREL